MNIMRIFKNIITAAALTITAAGLSSCYIRINNDLKAQFKNDLRYMLNKDMAKDTVTFDVGEFESITQEKSLDDLMFIQTDGEYKVKIVAYSETVDSVTVNNEDGTLRIGCDCDKATIGPVQAWVYAPSIKAISTVGSGNVRIGEYSGDSLVITAAGSGLIKAFNLDLSRVLMVNAAGSGDQKFRHISAEELIIIKAGSNDGDFSDINVGKLSVASIGSGDTKFSGKAESATISKKGSGEIDTNDLKVKDLHNED